MIFFEWNGQHSAGGTIVRSDFSGFLAALQSLGPSTSLDCLALRGGFYFLMIPSKTMFYYHLAGIPQGVH